MFRSDNFIVIPKENFNPFFPHMVISKDTMYKFLLEINLFESLTHDGWTGLDLIGNHKGILKSP